VNAGVWDGEYQRQDSGRNRYPAYDAPANGVFHDLRTPASQSNRVDPSFVTKNDGTGTTIMLSENVNAYQWRIHPNFMEPRQVAAKRLPSEEVLLGILWMNKPWVSQDGLLSTAGTSNSDDMYAINVGIDDVRETYPMELWIEDKWKRDPDEQLDSLVHYARPSSRHSGGVNVVYCDGHGSFLSDDIDWHVYSRLMSVAGDKAEHPGEITEPILRTPLSERNLNP
jgi:prepilin-type processing-associated H-X9-DG protein